MKTGTTEHAEKVAREAKKGMWDLRDKYISPKEWRRMQREIR